MGPWASPHADSATGGLPQVTTGQILLGCAILLVWTGGFVLTIAAVASPRLRERLWPDGGRGQPPSLRGALIGAAAFLGLFIATVALLKEPLRALGGWGVVAAGFVSQAVILVAVALSVTTGAAQGLKSLSLGGWRPRHALSSASAWLCSAWMVFAAALVCFGVYYLIARRPPPAMPVARILPQLSAGQQLALGALAVLVAPVCEELLFRGVIFGSLRARLGFWPAAAASGALFGAIHLSPVHVLPLAVLGVALAWVYERTGSLWTSVGLHAIQNATVMALFFTRSLWGG